VTDAASLGAVLTSARARLAAAGIPDPAREARWIWEWVSPEPASRGVVRLDEAVTPELVPTVEALVERRALGEPLAYVLGQTSFRWLTIHCDRRALIPRPETEGLVDVVLARQVTGRALDVGTGTGCIALSLAREGRYSAVIGSDRSPEALALAASNASRLGIAIQKVRGDLTEPIAASSVDLLVSNPPYISPSEYPRLDPGVRDWEPAQALVTGDGGMELTRRLLYDGRRVVRTGGLLALEIDCTRAIRAAETARDAGWVEVTLLDDLFGRARYLVARRGEES
jgi:release factor glutamine methyltransferase